MMQQHSTECSTKWLLASAKPEDSSTLRQQLSDCVADVTQWCSSRRLQLNADKTEAIWIGSRAAINKLSLQDRSLTVGTGTMINPSDVVRDLGVLLDSELTIKKHIAKVAAVCFFHIRRLRHIHRCVGKDVTIRLVLALITPQLDYCNSVFAGLPQSTLERYRECRMPLLGLCLTYVIVIMSRHT